MDVEAGLRVRARARATARAGLVRSAKVRSASTLNVGVKIMTYSPLLRRGVGGEANSERLV
jgi:hypothetical protein